MLIWLYWRRARPAVFAIGAVLVLLALLAVLAGVLAGPDQRRKAGVATGKAAPQLRASRLTRVNADSSRAVRLMLAAAAACQNDAYSGTQQVDWWSREGTSSYLVQVWHWPDEREFADGSAQPEHAGWRADPRPATPSVLGLADWMLSLIRADYQLGYAGTGVSLGRPALLVALRRGDGTLAARYWLDRQTSLPLRRQIFDSAGHLVSEGAYISLRLGETGDRELPTPRVSAWSPQPSADSAADLRALGWPVPASLGGLALVTLTGSSESSGSVVDGSYSDGLSVVSVFFQRGQLPGSLAGWHRARVSGEVVYSGEPDERSLTWSAHGFVYTVIADASPETVARVVAGLPHDSRDGGFWAQLGRGLRRIGSWFDPLG